MLTFSLEAAAFRAVGPTDCPWCGFPIGGKDEIHGVIGVMGADGMMPIRCRVRATTHYPSRLVRLDSLPDHDHFLEDRMRRASRGEDR